MTNEADSPHRRMRSRRPASDTCRYGCAGSYAALVSVTRDQTVTSGVTSGSILVRSAHYCASIAAATSSVAASGTAVPIRSSRRRRAEGISAASA